MNHEHRDLDAVEQWLVDAADGRANPAQTERIQGLLSADPVLRRHVARRLMDDSLLREELQIAEAEGLLSDQVVLPGLQGGQDRPVRWPRRKVLGYALAACAAAVAVSLLLGRHFAPPGGPTDRPTEEEVAAFAADSGGYAVLTQAVNVAWAAGAAPLVEGDRIARRPLRIDSGFLQVEFFGGATVVIEGPADLDVASESRIHCRAGKVRVSVPPQAAGLSVSTGDLELVDLGTEYAVRIGQDGAGEVHVLSGKVDVRKVGGESLRLVDSGAAVGFSSQGAVRPADVDGDKFVGVERLTAIRSSSDAAGLRRWRKHSKRWSQDPSLAMYFTFEGQAHFDRRLAGKVAARPMDGAIVGCRWAEGRFAAKGALEFKRTVDRVRVHVDGEFASVSLFANLRIDGFDRRYSSLLLADGYAPGKVHWQLTSSGALRFSVSGAGGAQSPRVITSSSLGRWVQLATVYDHQAQQVSHYVDGDLVGAVPFASSRPLTLGNAELGNWNSQKATNNEIRSLNGTVDEVAVFRRALSSEEIRQAYLAGKP